MRIARRWFTAPLVVTVAAPLACSSGSSDPSGKPGPAGPPRRDGGAAAVVSDLGRLTMVWRDGTACAAAEEERCPPRVNCNPPPPRQVECPPWMGDAAELRITHGPDGGCVDVPPGCKTSACATPSPCLDLAAPATLQWTIEPADDGRCAARPARRGAFDRVLHPVPIDCPTPGRAGIVERAAADAPCRACAAAPCEGSAPEVACPPDASPM